RRASPAPVAPGSATPASYPLSLHDALPISPAAARLRRESHAAAGGPAPTAQRVAAGSGQPAGRPAGESGGGWTWQILPTDAPVTDRKSTRLNSSHVKISYAVFCLKNKSAVN